MITEVSEAFYYKIVRYCIIKVTLYFVTLTYCTQTYRSVVNKVVGTTVNRLNMDVVETTMNNIDDLTMFRHEVRETLP